MGQTDRQTDGRTPDRCIAPASRTTRAVPTIAFFGSKVSFCFGMNYEGGSLSGAGVKTASAASHAKLASVAAAGHRVARSYVQCQRLRAPPSID